MKDISLVSVEEDVMKRILEEDKKSIRGRKLISEDKEKENYGSDVKLLKLDFFMLLFILKGSLNLGLFVIKESLEVTYKIKDFERRDK